MISIIRILLFIVCCNYSFAGVGLPNKPEDLVYWAANSVKKVLSVDYTLVKSIDKYQNLFTKSGFTNFKQANQDNFANIKKLSLSVKLDYKDKASVVQLQQPDMWQIKLPAVISYFAKQVAVDYPVEIKVVLQAKLGQDLPRIHAIDTLVVAKESTKLVMPRGCNLRQVS